MRKLFKAEMLWAVVVVAAFAQFMAFAVPIACDQLAAAGKATELVLLLPVWCGFVAPQVWRWLAYAPTIFGSGVSTPA
jgi:hypothetical protein